MTERPLFIHPQAICETDRVGAGTRIWAFAHVLPGAVLGDDCNICDGVFIENDVIVGSRVTVKCGVQLWDGTRLEDDVFVGPNATFTNDLFPRSRQARKATKPTIVREGASIGANATILPGVEIGKHAMVGAGAVVTRPVPPHSVVVGNPARIRGYVGSTGEEEVAPEGTHEHSSQETGIAGVRLYRMPEYRDLRGSLISYELGQAHETLPFVPSRIFFVFEVPSPEVRGAHAHHVCGQLLVCVNGSVNVVADDGDNRKEFLLNDRSTGLYLPPMTWSMQYGYSESSVLMVMASHPYDPNDYIREYDEFLRIRNTI